MANGTYGTPMTMGMTAGMGSQPMTTTGLQAGVVRNMNLPLSRATPIQVTETTPNLEEIQNFPVAGRGLDGTHFHQDPVSGQMYVMTEEFHQRITEILSNTPVVYSDMTISNNNLTSTPSTVYNKNLLNNISFGEENISIDFDFFEEDKKSKSYDLNIELFGFTSDNLISSKFYYENLNPVQLVNSINNTNQNISTIPNYESTRFTSVNRYFNRIDINPNNFYSRYTPINVFYNTYVFGQSINNFDINNQSQIVMTTVEPLREEYRQNTPPNGLNIFSVSSIINRNDITNDRSGTGNPDTSKPEAVHVFTRVGGRRMVILKGESNIPDGMYQIMECFEIDDGNGPYCSVQFKTDYFLPAGIGSGIIRYPPPCNCDF